MGYVGVRHRRIRHEHLEQPLPAPGQAGERVANDLGSLIGEETLVDLGPVRHSTIELGIIVAKHDPLVRRQAAQALVPSCRRQP